MVKKKQIQFKDDPMSIKAIDSRALHLTEKLIERFNKTVMAEPEEIRWLIGTKIVNALFQMMYLPSINATKEAVEWHKEDYIDKHLKIDQTGAANDGKITAKPKTKRVSVL